VDRVLLAECEPELGRGSEAWQAAERMRACVDSLNMALEALAGTFDSLAGGLQGAEELAGDIRAQAAGLREICQDTEFIITGDDETYVYWVERAIRDRATYYSIRAAPLQIGKHIRAFFLNEKRCVVFTSATLQVDGRFDYMLERLGADELPAARMRCLAVGSPFDYDRQAIVAVTGFLPDPGGRRDTTFDRELSTFLIDLLQRTCGRAMVLFTSYSLLEATYSAIKTPLARAGIVVMAQGHSGSREAITSTFRHVTSSVLLGTRSFWEGVDISGETLSCLVLTKLPFHVVTDPLVRGRMGYLEALGKPPFAHYTLPDAVIAFRQGFGRLIRNRSDRGVVLVTDKRLLTKKYARTFLASLPTKHHVYNRPDEALDAVTRFFSQG
jgi:Rad3-related DNA helicase